MTDERTDKQISAAIAERLFGITRATHSYLWAQVVATGRTWRTVTGNIFLGEPYAEDHNAAMGLVVPEMRTQGYWFELADMSGGRVRATFGKDEGGRWSARAPVGQEPRAICLAALAAMDAEMKAE